jgi:DNA-binding response OmpR family regulator
MWNYVHIWHILPAGDRIEASQKSETGHSEASALATIVLADDDGDLREVYSTFLKAAGHTVYEAIDGRQALEVVRRIRPEILLLDIWMPALNGFEVLETLRHDAAGLRLKIIVVSSLGDADSRLEAFEAGATAYLVKGRALTEVLKFIEDTLNESLAEADENGTEKLVF